MTWSKSYFNYSYQMNIRPAKISDIDEILALIYELALYEKAPEEAKATRSQIMESFFSDTPKVFCEIVEVGGEIAGLAIWFLNYSTWQGKHGIYLEDLFVRPQFRGRGIGKALLKHLAQICVNRGYGRFQWWVLDWNEPSIEFYKALGAIAMDEWTVYRVTGDALTELAADDK
jgi:GNAT superfamily N-acetyltransferase